MKQSRAKTDSSLPSQTEGPGDSPFARNKLRSYSMRLKNGRSSQRRRQQQLDSTGQEDEIIPLFERDVAELDTGVDLPDETLLTDHISSGDKDVSFGRMKPLRFSVGRKLSCQQEFASQTASSTPTVSPVTTPIHTPVPNTPMHVPITTPIFLPSPMQSPALPLTPATFPDLTPAQLQELRLLTGSPVSHDMPSHCLKTMLDQVQSQHVEWIIASQKHQQINTHWTCQQTLFPGDAGESGGLRLGDWKAWSLNTPATHAAHTPVGPVDPAFLFMVAATAVFGQHVTLVSVDPALVARLSGCLSPMSTVLPLPRIDPFKLESGLRMLARDRVWLVLIS